MRPWALVLPTSAVLFSCTIGEGTGEVTSDQLFAENCWSGPFDLAPTFFAANPDSRGDSMTIRVQRGENPVEVSDGLILVINDVSSIRNEQLGQGINVGLPIGVSPPGLPDPATLKSPQVSLTLYLYNTCHVQNSALHSIGGTINFASLFSGDRNENNAGDLLTDATFEATLVDPRDVLLIEDETAGTLEEVFESFPEERVTNISGRFRFFFERGVPAQPFP